MRAPGDGKRTKYRLLKIKTNLESARKREPSDGKRTK